ncbi:MAG: hypothetical protein ABI145_15620, partial [Steroidobacteraceae bacterium]
RAGEVEAADRELVEAADAAKIARTEEEIASSEALRIADEAEALRVSVVERDKMIAWLTTERHGLAPLLRRAGRTLPRTFTWLKWLQEKVGALFR